MRGEGEIRQDTPCRGECGVVWCNLFETLHVSGLPTDDLSHISQLQLYVAEGSFRAQFYKVLRKSYREKIYFVSSLYLLENHAVYN